MRSGEFLNHYRIERPLGQGGMGEVYAAEDTKLRRLIALKILPSLAAYDPERRERFEREAQIVASLNHPNIVTIHSVELAGEIPFLTMELVEGKTLVDIIPHDGLPIARLLAIATALTDAMMSAHQRGIVHRDLKPANIMVSDDGRVKVLDFGVAKLKEVATPVGLTTMPAQPITAEGRIVGTVQYMSPEQAEGKAVDQRSDIFSLGVLFYTMATSQLPFKGDTGLAILASIIRDTPPPPSDLNNALPSELDRIVKRCLAKDPLRRYQSAVDVRNDLEELRQDVAVRTSQPALPRQSSSSRRISTRVATAFVTIAVATILGVAAYTWLARRSSPPVSDPTNEAGARSRRVVVSIFENRTGDATLQALGSLVADRLIQGVTETGLADVRSTPATLSAANGSAAGTLIAGAYYLQGTTLEFQAQVLEMPSGKLLHALEAVSAPQSSAPSAIEILRQRVMGAIAAHLGDAIEDLPWLSHVPTYDAYREFTSGLEFFSSDPGRAQKHFERALALEPDFFDPRFYAAVAYSNVGNRPLAGLTVAPLVEHRDRLTPFERGKLDWFTAYNDGRRTEALAALIEARKINPQSFIVNYLLGFEYLRLNHPKAAIGTFDKLQDQASSANRGAAGPGGSQGAGMWRNATALARHIVGDFERELLDAHEATRLVPQSINYRGVEARALIGLGNFPEALRVVEDSLALPGSAGGVMLGVTRELRAHGEHRRSIELAHRTVEWYRNRPPDVASAQTVKAALGYALYSAERWDDARDVFVALVRQFPDDVDYNGILGVLAARRGDRIEATKISERLRQLFRPYLDGAHTFWRARISAQLGEETSAIDLLRDAFAQGAAFTIEIHRDIDLEPLKNNAAFRELVRPKD